MQHTKITTLLVKPVLFIGYGDFENRLYIELKNKGMGVAIIRKIIVRNEETSEIKNSLFGWMPTFLPSPMNYKFYLSLSENFPMSVNERACLIDIEMDDKKKDQAEMREKIRSIICKLVLEVSYEDLLGNNMKTFIWSFNYFGRNDNVNQLPIDDNL